VASYEKYVIDVQILESLQREFTPVDFSEEELAFGAHEEVGAGGHFLGAEHTMERFRTCFYRPFLWNSDNYERWMRLGGRDTVERAREIYEKKLEEYEQPPLDESIRAELEEYVVRRRAELGD
jgi:trimethylamine--corrinoid protein Co-methyltransferase